MVKSVESLRKRTSTPPLKLRTKCNEWILSECCQAGCVHLPAVSLQRSASLSASVSWRAATKPVVCTGKYEYEELLIHKREFTNKNGKENLKNTEKTGVKWQSLPLGLKESIQGTETWKKATQTDVQNQLQKVRLSPTGGQSISPRCCTPRLAGRN